MDSQRTVDDYRSGVVHARWVEICRFLLTEDEWRTLRIEIVDDRGEPVAGGATVGANDYYARVTIAGDVMNAWLFEPRSDAEIDWQFYNDLQDFIAESTFGWGELRGPVWRAADDESPLVRRGEPGA